MVNFNIHWKGCPHRTFPRIDIASNRSQTNFTRCASHANKGTCEIHNCRALEQARRKEKTKARSRRSRASKSFIVTRSQNRASKQARQEVFGWESPSSDITRQDQDSDNCFPSAESVVESKLPHSYEIIDESRIHSVDGAGCSSFNRVKGSVAKYNIKTQAGSRTNSINSRQLTGAAANQVRRYQANPGTTAPQDSRVYSRSLYRKYHPSILNGFVSPARSRAFLAASTLASLYEEKNSTRLNTTQAEISTSGDPSKKEISTGSTSFIKASRLASLAQGNSFPPSVHSIVQSITSSPSSRSPSQRRALKRFTRELELYLQTAKQAPKQTPISSAPSTSFSTQTIETIQEFKPYHAEFQAVGLAVTSAEQRNRSVLGVQSYGRRSTVPEVQPVPYEHSSAGLLAKSEIDRRRSLSDIEEPLQATLPDDEMGIKGSNVLIKKSVPDHAKPDREISTMSFASEETVIEWTPAYERDDPNDRLESPPCCDLAHPRASSPGKAYRPESVVPPERPRSPAKKSLPWLRKPPTSAEPAPDSGAAIKHARLSNLAGDAAASPPYSEFTSQPNSQSSSIVLHLDTPPEHTRSFPDQIPRTPTTTTSSDIPITPAATIYQHSFVGPEEGDNIGVADFAGLEHLPNQPRAVLTIGDVIAQKDTRLLKNHATQTSAAPSFITRAPHFTTQIPVTVQSQQRRGLVLKSSLIDESQRRQLSQEAKIVSISGPAPPHQIPRAASTVASSCSPQSPLRCTQCNVELNTIKDSKVRSNMASVPSPSIGFGPTSKKKNMRMCEIPEAVHCEGCNLSMTELDKCTNTIASQSFKRQVERDVRWQEHDEMRRTGIGLKEKQRKTNSSADEECFARQSDVRKSGGKSTSEQILAPLPDPVKRRSILDRVPPPQSNSTSIPTPIQATQSNQSTSPDYVQGQVLSYAKLPDIPILLDINPKLSVSESVGDLQSQLRSLEKQTRHERDTKKMFRGLRVATAAACEDGVDIFIEEITGYKVRKLLTDLSALDGLGVNSLAHVARQTAQKRRGDIRRLQMTKISTEKDRKGNFERGFGFGDGDGDGGDGSWRSSLEEVAKIREKGRGKLPRSQSGERRKNNNSVEKPSRDRALGLVAGDQGIRMREEAEAVFDEANARED
ncbi:e93ea88c-4aa3-4004-89f4-50891e164bfe [Sclerotinia trifoliorum]|uniref:E93ea88c-4aa3-4004-89f4-50891e164bfe n=1 Tax=Sclerotinia trifoliorum TaxID=28548 RepID=A0A8H2W0K5_9HELO|nr:e93ea88c-4aa3-4004-89f4-50891e164bfe [Sclerotinia trifoliorum]